MKKLFGFVLMGMSMACSGAEIRVGAVDWDCSVPRGTYFGNATAKSLGPEHWRDRTPFYAKVLGKDKLDTPFRTQSEYGCAATRMAQRWSLSRSALFACIRRA